MNAQSPHKWWSTLKSAVFGLSSSLPSLVGGGGELVCESVGKADLLSDHFDIKKSRESVDLPLTCHPSPSLTSLGLMFNCVVMVELCRHHFRYWDLEDYHFTLIYFRLATILFNHCN